MSIFSAPSFYSQADQDIYNRGFSFIPQEQFRSGAFKIPGDGSVENDTFRQPTGITSLGGGGGGGGNNPFNPDMNQIRTDFRPDFDFRQYQDFGNLTDDQLTTAQRKEMDMNPEYYGLGTGVPKTGIAGIIDSYMKNSLIGRGLGGIKNFLQDKLPINTRAIMENQLRGSGILTDDIGRIVAGSLNYNTPEGIMAGYSANQLTDATFDKRQDRIGQTLGDKYGISASDVQGLIDGTLDDDDISAKYGITTNLTSQIRNIELARQNILGAKTKAQEIADFRNQQRIDAINRKKAEAKAAGDAAKARALQIKAAAKAQGISRKAAIAQQEAIDKDRGSTTGDDGPRGDMSGGRSSGSGETGFGGFCFDPNTLVQMADGSEKKIKEIQLGDQTKGGEVTGVFQFKASDEIHDYKGVTVAGSHYVKENGRFIMVQDSPISVKIDKIPVVYSLDTTGRRIFIKDIEFADYNGDGIAKGFLANAGVNLTGFDKEVLRQVENRLI